MESSANGENTSKRDPETALMKVATLVGVLGLFTCVIIGGILSAKHVGTGQKPQRPGICFLAQLGYKTELFAKPWDAANPQFFLLVMLVGAFVLRKYVLVQVTEFVYPHLEPGKKIKIASYMLEIVAATIALLVPSTKGYWKLLFFPREFEHPTPKQTEDLAVGGFAIVNIVALSYILTLSFDSKIRLGLVLHHWTTIVLIIWAYIVYYEVNYDIYWLRLGFVATLYMTTEQNVYLELLFYYKEVGSAVFFYISAWFYLITRLVLSGLILWAWWGCKNSTFSEGVSSTSVYGLFLFLPLANLVLNLTQLTTVISMFGIANRVFRQETKKGSGKKITSILLKAFSAIDLDNSGAVDFEQFSQFVQALNLPLTYPEAALMQLFWSMNPRHDRQLSCVVLGSEFCKFHTDNLLEVLSSIPDHAQPVSYQFILELSLLKILSRDPLNFFTESNMGFWKQLPKEFNRLSGILDNFESQSSEPCVLVRALLGRNRHNIRNKKRTNSYNLALTKLISFCYEQNLQNVNN